MDIHHKVVGVLHILAAAISLLLIAAAILFFGFVSALEPVDEFPFTLLLAFGAVFAGFFALVSLTELIAGAMLLSGKPGARPWVIGFGVLQLLNIPFGTALGIYTLWALMRKQPSGIVAAHTSLPRV